MPINSHHLRVCVVRPVLKHLDLWSPVAENLLLGTAAQESLMGTYLDQRDPDVVGPAVGIYQMETATYADLWDQFVWPKFFPQVQAFLMPGTSLDQFVEMQGNLYYATAMARLKYYSVKEPLPSDPSDIKALARYWKLYYNTPLGKGHEEEFVANYEHYVHL